MPAVEVVRTYLELTDRAALRARPLSAHDTRVVLRTACSPAEYRALYRLVGERWHWRDRLAWSDERLAARLAMPEVHVWELRAGDPVATAGYFELEQHAPNDVEIAYFGLAPGFIGRGLGAGLLTRAVEEAWRLGADRVWLHTCTLDSPHALPNYRARGFRVYRTETYQTELADSA